MEEKINLKEFVNSNWGSNETLLHIAVSLDNLELVKACIKLGVNINAQGYNDSSALFYVKSLDVLKYLIQNKADTNILNSYGETAVVSLYGKYAIYAYDKNNIYQYLIPLTDLDLAKDKNSYTLLQKMIKYGECNLDLLKDVISKTKNLNRTDEYGNSLLIEAAKRTKYKDVTLLLIKAGMDMYIRNDDNKNFYAVTFQYIQKIIEKDHPEFMKLKDYDDNQRLRYLKIKKLQNID